MLAPSHLALTSVLVAMVASTAVIAPAPTSSALSVTDGAAGAASPAPGCDGPLLDRAMRASAVKRAPDLDFAAAARVNGLAVRELAADAKDESLWIDRCGHSFYVEPAVAEGPDAAGADVAAKPVQAAQAGAPTDPGPLSSTFLLESKPGSSKTIYLDFNGGTVAGTGWNENYTSGAPIIAPPYSISAPADTNFTAAELTEIQKAWQVVAEDYAPFDVNVTTKPPAPGAIERTGSADLLYGTRVLVTSSGPMCSCGGIAYVDTFSRTTSSAYFQPAWVYTNGTSTSGKKLGEAASHEAGHNLGLDHDGTSSPVADYYSGVAPWAPVMGASYNQPVSQWSAGEYPSATNAEDDVAQISTHVPVRPDDHVNAAPGATPLATMPVEGVIATRTDTDAFTFVAGGATTITASPGPGFPDLDIGLKILNSSGTVVATVDPPVTFVSSTVANGLSATWSATLPDPPATYTAVVDGVGSGTPTTPGKYSDYGSLGHYRIALVTAAAPPTAPAPLAATSSDPTAGTVGVAYTATPAAASGGTPPYTWAATTALPPGLAVASGAGAISGTPTTAAATPVTLKVTDALGASATTSFTLTIHPAPEGPGTAPPPQTTPSPTPTPGSDTVPAVSAQPLAVATTSRTTFSQPLIASGGNGAHLWMATGAPAGVTVSPTGLVTGSVALPGTYSFPVTVTSGPRAAATTVTLNVVRRRSLAFATTKRLPIGRADRRYSTTISTRGAEGRLTWKTPGSTLPGLKLKRPKGGRIALVVTTSVAGTYKFTLVVTDATGARRQRRFILNITR